MAADILGSGQKTKMAGGNSLSPSFFFERESIISHYRVNVKYSAKYRKVVCSERRWTSRRDILKLGEHWSCCRAITVEIVYRNCFNAAMYSEFLNASIRSNFKSIPPPSSAGSRHNSNQLTHPEVRNMVYLVYVTSLNLLLYRYEKLGIRIHNGKFNVVL